MKECLQRLVGLEAHQLGLSGLFEASVPVTVADIELYGSYTADMIILTSTSLYICPVTKINGVEIGSKEQVWGSVTKQLAEACSRFVGHDFVDQSLKHDRQGMPARTCQRADYPTGN